jgi:GTP-binding protein YchF
VAIELRGAVITLSGDRDELGAGQGDALGLADDGSLGEAVAGDDVWTRIVGIAAGGPIEYKYLIGSRAMGSPPRRCQHPASSALGLGGVGGDEGCMRVAIVGFAGSGKSTLFNALTGLDVATGDYGGGKVKLGTIQVPDPRVDVLAEIYQPKKVTRAELVCVDLPGRHDGGGREGLDSATLERIRPMAALALVVGGFGAGEGPGGQTVRGPADEAVAYLEELILADLVLVETRLERLRKEPGKHNIDEVARLEVLQAHLGSGQPLRRLELGEEEWARLKHYAFVSDKPVVVVVNVDEEALETGQGERLAEPVRALGYPTFVLSGALEDELSHLTIEEQREFLAHLGIEQTARDRFIRAAFDALDLITALTVGADEVRAWPIPRGYKAKRAAGRIHSDLERGFIRAEVFHYDELVEVGSEAALKKAGRIRVEGKDYVVRDGDILVIRHSG